MTFQTCMNVHFSVITILMSWWIYHILL